MAGRPVILSFTPHLVPLNRGIVSTIYLDAINAANALTIYREFYRKERFIRVTEALPDTKNVERTNFCDMSVRFDSRTGKLIVVSVFDETMGLL